MKRAGAGLILRGGPFDGYSAGILPPDTPAPVQIVWAGFFVGGHVEAHLYEWHGATEQDAGITVRLVYAHVRRLPQIEPIPPAVEQAIEPFAAFTQTVARIYGLPDWSPMLDAW